MSSFTQPKKHSTQHTQRAYLQLRCASSGLHHSRVSGRTRTVGFPLGWIGYEKRMQPRTLMLSAEKDDAVDILWATSMAALEP
jgi:hypothetical protein